MMLSLPMNTPAIAHRLVLASALAIATGGILAAVFFSSLQGGDRLWPLSWVAWAPVGFIILLRRPDNGVGRAMMFVGVTVGISFASLALTVTDLPLSVRTWTEFVNVVFGVAPWLGIVWIVLVFPSSTYPGRAESLTGRVLIAYGLVATLAFALSPQPMEETGVASPFALEPARPIATLIVEGPGFVGVIVLMLGALALLIRRWRAGTGLERAQYRWLVYGVALYLGVLSLSQFLPDDSAGLFLWLPAGLAIPTTIGVAVLRYRLFEIDRIISRTLTYAVVAGLLAVAFLTVIAALTGVMPSDDPFVVALATLAAAALFSPVRRRVQRTVDRRFNRTRYDTQTVMDSFSDSLRDRMDATGLVDGWVGVVAETMEPNSMGVWVRDGAT